MDLMESVESIFSYGTICDHCLGRFFGRRSFGLSNACRGAALRVSHAMWKNIPFKSQDGSCWLCNDFFATLDPWVARMESASQGIAFSTFVVGSKVPPLISEGEEMVWSDLALDGTEPLKSQVNREIGKLFSEKTGKTADLSRPDLIFVLVLDQGTVDLQIAPVFFSGRYRKLIRGIPQTHWDCRSCRGEGCEACHFTGKQYTDSVEELIGRPVITAFDAQGAVLHGAGREDIDARMIGTGRPFVMEVVAPRRRDVPLNTLEGAVNHYATGRVEVTLTGHADRADVQILKSHRWVKKYRIQVEIDGSVSPEELCSALSALNGAQIAQRTPIRVAHRRADKVRQRTVLAITCLGPVEGEFLIGVTGEAGLYIKELISGDAGRTRPSLTEILGRPARVTHLDVIEVADHLEETTHGTPQRHSEEDTV
ncbi:MAG: tRNA pseudouridine(54/55) synthase Pus10 [Methanomicrobiales archaeon]|jgi:tRNA pseudouridine synthase 10|nr:tRNA pseudouridine(54/55) synthase Pus10 [Methanomicrobiales archaeon]